MSSDYSVLKARPSKKHWTRKHKRVILGQSYWSVTMTVRFHLFPFRTQKLSSLVPKIVRWKRRVKIGSRRLKWNPWGRNSLGVCFYYACTFPSKRPKNPMNLWVSTNIAQTPWFFIGGGGMIKCEKYLVSKTERSASQSKGCDAKLKGPVIWQPAARYPLRVR